MIEDAFNRKHNYLRISLTSNCNLRCFYCMPEETYVHTPSSAMMQAAEIHTLAGLFAQLGVTKIRLTGGEPLVRKDAAAILLSLAQLPVSLALTSNGICIPEHLAVLQEAGVQSINISLDTLQPEKFKQLTKRDLFDKVWHNIHLLLNNGFHVKVNMVVMKGINDDELTDFVSWTQTTPVHVRFIEFMPFSGNRWDSTQVFTWQQMIAAIEKQFPVQRLADAPNDTAKKYQVPGHAGSFAIISTMSAPFCNTCNRMRLTADGKMKNCLFSTGETDLLTPLRNGEDIVPLIQQCIGSKARERGGQFDQGFEQLQAATLHNRSMIAIGG